MGCQRSRVAPVKEPIPVKHPVPDAIPQPTTPSITNPNDSEQKKKKKKRTNSLTNEHIQNVDDNQQLVNSLVNTQKNPIIDTVANDNDFVEIEVADPQAFNNSFIQQRQQAINNQSYRLTIQSWRPNSLEQLVNAVKSLSENKSLVDCHWIMFYWIAYNIEYDTVSYFSKNYKDQTAEGVFRTKKGVCAGYANIYKYLCDQLNIPCEKISGYSKGYGFDEREGAPDETDHAWNAVEIDHHWYLVESTWGAGHLTEQKTFQHKLDSYYFFARPNEMIYHHLPENDKWQLLRKSINMKQYLQMPKIHPIYFQLNLDLISPRNQAYVDLLPDKSYALVLIRVPSDVRLIANLKLHKQNIEGGHRVVFDNKKQMYCCYFAPNTIGKHEITIYGKRGDTEGEYSGALELTLNVNEIPKNPISFPETWQIFFDLNLNVISPENTHLLKVYNGQTHTEVQIQTPNTVELLGRLVNIHGEKIQGGHEVFYDRHKNLWRCKFAPNCNGIFDAEILAKKKTDTGHYTSALKFKVEAKNIPTPPLSYPKAWQIFFDLNLNVISPKNTHLIKVHNGQTHTEVQIQTPNTVELLGRLVDIHGEKIQGGHEVFYDRHKNLWRCKFAPNHDGMFDAEILAKKKTDTGHYTSAVTFKIEAKNIPTPPLSYPKASQIFFDLNLNVISPKNTYLIKVHNGQTHAEILIQTPNTVELLGRLVNIHGEKIQDGHETFYDRHKNLWRCKFAPNHDGMFDAEILAKKKTDTGLYASAVTFKIEAKNIPTPPLSYPQASQIFFDLNLNIISPKNTHLLKVYNGQTHTEVQIQTPNTVELLGRLVNIHGEKIQGGHETFYDRHKNFWRCKFAPNCNGIFDAEILAKKKTDTGHYTYAVTFKIEAKNIPTPPLSYPQTWPLFYELDLKIETPRHRSTAVWPENASFSEIRMSAPNDVEFSCGIEFNGNKEESCTLAQFDNNKQQWQFLFAPQRTGLHKLIVYARRLSDFQTSYGAVAEFDLNVTKLRKPIKFPLTYAKFPTYKCRIYEPLHGVLKKDAVVPIHCVIPGATAVDLQVDSNWIKTNGYEDPILKTEITVGSKDVTIYAKYGQNTSYDGLVRYSVE